MPFPQVSRPQCEGRSRRSDFGFANVQIAHLDCQPLRAAQVSVAWIRDYPPSALNRILTPLEELLDAFVFIAALSALSISHEEHCANVVRAAHEVQLNQSQKRPDPQRVFKAGDAITGQEFFMDTL